MPNELVGVYDPLFYANEGLIALQSSLGMAARVHRGYDKAPQTKGTTIQIKRPSVFEAKDAPSDDQDVKTSMVEVKLDYWKEVKMSFSDKELTATGEEIITDHIQPAAYAIAKDIDDKLNGLAAMVPWYVDAEATTSVADITELSRVMFENKVPMDDGKLHLEVGATMRAGFQSLFINSAVVGESSQEVLRSGHIGNRLGFDIFGNQNVGRHTKGTCSTSTLAANGAYAKGSTFINMDATAVTGTLMPGDSFAIAGHVQRYVVANPTAVSASGNAFTGVMVFPPLAQDVADNAVITFSFMNYTRNLGFHRNAFALAMAPLSDIGEKLSSDVKVANVVDVKTGLAMRARLWYNPDTSRVKFALDALYGVKCLDPNLACLLRK